jgi:hypothetical protein
MIKRFITIICIGFQVALVTAKAELTLPPYPPQDWYLSIRFTFSQNIFLSFLNKKPGKDQYISNNSLSISIFHGCNIKGSTLHPVLTGKVTKGYDNTLTGFECIGFIPKADQSATYSAAFNAIKSFNFTQESLNTDYDSPGIDISIDMQINGRSISVQYNKLKKSDDLPAGLSDLLALLRRNLPANHDRLLDYLKVPKLPPLSGDAAVQYKKCEVHNEWMKVDEIPIAYGLPSYDKKYTEARDKLFPNANTYSCGVCCVSPDSPEKEKALYCESCRKAKIEWEKKHKKSKRSKKSEK